MKTGRARPVREIVFRGDAHLVQRLDVNALRRLLVAIGHAGEVIEDHELVRLRVALRVEAQLFQLMLARRDALVVEQHEGADQLRRHVVDEDLELHRIAGVLGARPVGRAGDGKHERKRGEKPRGAQR
jgi:hypothetical protein